MKKIVSIIFAILCFSTVVFAEAIPIEFRKYGGGQYIYCNNPEFLTPSDLSTDENPTPTYMMKNENLGPDNYSVFFCFYNWTSFDVEPDIEFVSDDAVITINSVGYYIPQGHDYWDCIGAWSDLMGINIRTLNNYQQYVPYQGIDLPKTFTLDGGREWINKFIYNYEPVSPRVTFNMLVNFTIESGTADVNFTALKNYGNPGDRTHHVETAASGTYKNDTSVKGIETESLPVVEADLNIEITEDTPNGERLPVKIFNQYFPDGNESDFWMTNINPSRDMYYYSKGVAAGSDMLTLRFEDDAKEQYYGENATERDNVFLFDIYHYNTLGYEEGMPWGKEDHVPNAYMGEILDLNNLPDIRWQFNLGNFGVVSRYNLTITNSDDVNRTLNYMLETSVSSNIVIVRDEHGTMLNPYTLKSKYAFALCKGTHETKTEDCMFSVNIPAGKTKKYILDVILPTNCYGGIVNYLVADNHKYLKTQDVTEFPEYTEFYDYKNSFFNGKRLMKWEDGKLYTYNAERWQQLRLPESAREIFSSRMEDMRVVRTPEGYAAKFSAWDEYGYNVTDTSSEKNVYLFDSKFEYVDKVEFEEYVTGLVYADNKVYVEAGEHRYVSTDGKNFKKRSDAYDMPRTNGSYAIFKKDNEFYLTGIDGLSKIAFESREPYEIHGIGGIFYRLLSWKNYDYDLDTGNVIAVSADGVNWVEVYLPNRLLQIKNMEYRDNDLYIYCKYETFVYEDIIPEDNIKVKLNNEYLAFDIPAKVIDNRTMVPLRFIFEKLDAKVTWIDKTREIVVESDDADITLAIDSNVAVVNGEEVEIDVPPVIDGGKTLIPIRFLAENLGYEVDWYQEQQTAVIKK